MPLGKEQADNIKFDRAGGHCEQCNAPHGEMIYRNPKDKADYVTMRGDGELILPNGAVPDDYGDQYPADGGYVVRLSVVFLDYNKENTAPDNLKALCQLCKLWHNDKTPAKIARVRKQRNKRPADTQMSIFDLLKSG